MNRIRIIRRQDSDSWVKSGMVVWWYNLLKYSTNAKFFFICPSFAFRLEIVDMNGNFVLCGISSSFKYGQNNKI